MLRSLNNLYHFNVEATDGRVGQLANLFFDDELWVARFMVVETDQPAYQHRHVLVSPIAVLGVDESPKSIRVSLTQEALRNSPHIDTNRPVSRQREIEYYRHHEYPAHWRGLGIWGYGGYPYELNAKHALYDPIWVDLSATEDKDKAANDPVENQNDPHLRSADEVVGYAIHATDGDIGHVEDLLIDQETWEVRYLVVKTGHWWKGARVLIVPRAIDEISWTKSKVMVSLTREAVKHAPLYKSVANMNEMIDQASVA